MKFQRAVSDSDLGKLQDDELVRLFVALREGRFFEELFRRHSRSVFMSCLEFFQNAAEAEDASQETFLRAYQHMDSFDGRNFRAWLLKIAKNHCIDRWRKRLHRPEESYDDSPVELPDPTEEGVGKKWHIAVLHLEREMAALPPDQRDCLELKAEGFSYEETALRIGGSTEDVRSHLQNGRRTLRLRMAEVLSEIL